MIIYIYKEERYYNIKKRVDQSKKCKFKGNIHHYSQVNFAYNSNKKVFLIYTNKHEQNMYKSIASCLLVNIDNKRNTYFL